MVTGRPRTSTRSTAPYRLHTILREHQIPQGDLRRAITFEAGKRVGEPIAASTLSALIVRRIWPSTVSVELIQRRVAEFLLGRGIAADVIATAWDTPAGVGEAPPADRPLLSVGRRAATNHPADPDPFQAPEPEMLSTAAKEHFRLPRHPFVDDVQGPHDVYLSKDQRYIRESMYYAAKHSGLIAVIGESGSGKSTLRRDLVERIRRDSEQITVLQPQCIDKRQLNAAHICDAIIADLSGEAPKLSLEAKARQIHRALASSARNGNSHVLMIEEAHDLSTNTLKFLKRFWELEDGFRKLLGVVLIGQSELAIKFDLQKNPDLREVIQRFEIATLRPLNGNLEEYLALKFKRIGTKLDDVFEPDAYDAIRNRLTRRRAGIAEVESHIYPLIVHNLLIKCMNQAVELGLPKISAQLVGRV